MKNYHLREVFFPHFNFTQLFRIMKLTTLMLFLTIWQLQAVETYAQSTTVNLSLKNVKIEEVFKAIEHQSDFDFFYNDKQIDASKLVTINVKNTKISEVIKNLFADKDLTYKVIGNHIVLIKADLYENELLKTVLEDQQKQQKVSGKVTDISGLPLPGVVVNVKGTNKSVVTDAYGKYSIAVSENDKVLVFSFIGMIKKEITITGQTNQDVVLESEVLKLDEVVVVGYGVQKKKLVTGATVSVKGDNLKKLNTTNALQALQGQAAGVNITSSSGQPGGGYKVNIRDRKSVV